ncbi:MAG: tlde1 domain-containing protein [Ketobacter sp.]
MSWEYDQSSGIIRLNGAYMGKGYAGKGMGRDNPDMEKVGFTGPIPRGTYEIGEPYTHPILGPIVMALEPVGHNAHGRTDFRIHGDNQTNDASEGCIVLPPIVRRKISESSVKKLEVVR